jgi:Yip1 domain
MNLIDRVKNMLLTPQTEWEVVKGETATPMSLLTGYVLPLAAVGSVGSILSALLFSGGYGIKFGIAMVVITLIVTVVSYYLSVLIVDALAPSFTSEKDVNKTAQLVAYSSTPGYVAGLLSWIPIIGWLLTLAAWAYGIYIMYLGIGPLKKTPEDKKVVYLIVSYLIIGVIYFVLLTILSGIVVASLITSAGGIGALR